MRDFIQKCYRFSAVLVVALIHGDVWGFVLLMSTIIAPSWLGIDSVIGQSIRERNEQCLRSYREYPDLIEEHCNTETEISQGGYGQRQIYELVQNGADALLVSGLKQGKIQVVLTADALYCANEGEPITPEGTRAILMSQMSSKKGNEIGRFGLGFKSVLNIATAPEFYSRSGSFRFSPLKSLEWVKEYVPGAKQAPTLRLAQPVNPEEASALDPVLRQLMQWATTVVKLPKRRGDWLASDLAQFPAEFLLFSPHVGSVVLTDRTKVQASWSPSEALATERTITAEVISRSIEFTEVALSESGSNTQDKQTLWRVFSLQHKPSDVAREDGGRLAERESLPIAWAVPVQGQLVSGTFWSFYPTHAQLTLAGILNAPWMTDNSRQEVLENRFNHELLEVASKLVVQSLSCLQDAADPGRILEYLPWLDRNPSWGDIHLRDRIYEEILKWPCLPDTQGSLKLPTQLRCHPRVPLDALEQWHFYPAKPTNWVHPSADTRIRRARLDYIVKASGREPARVRSWLAALVEDQSPASSAAALRVAAQVIKEGNHRIEVAETPIVLSSQGQWVPPKVGTVFLPPVNGVGDEHALLGLDGAKGGAFHLVADAVLENQWARDDLIQLGITPLELAVAFEAIVAKLKAVEKEGFEQARFEAFPWGQFWQVSRTLPFTHAANLLSETWLRPGTVVRAKTVSGTWAPLHHVLLPGRVVAAKGEGEDGVLIDTDYHQLDEQLMRRLGATDVPHPGWDMHQDFYDYPDHSRMATQAWARFLRAAKARCQQTSCRFTQKQITGPLEPYFRLQTDLAKKRFCLQLLKTVGDDEPWLYSHNSKPGSFPQISCPPPSLQLLQDRGVLETSVGYSPTKGTFSSIMQRWDAILPVARLSIAHCEVLGLWSCLDDVPQPLMASLADREAGIKNERLLGELYAAFARAKVKRSKIWARVGDNFEEKAPSEVAIESDPQRLDVVHKLGVPYLAASPEDTICLRDLWGLFKPTFTSEVEFEIAGEPEESGSIFPQVWFSGSDELQALTLQPCKQISVKVLSRLGAKRLSYMFRREGNTAYYDQTLPRPELLESLVSSLTVPLSPEKRREIESESSSGSVGAKGDELLSKIGPSRSLAQKLLLCVGERAIKQQLPQSLLKTDKVTNGEPTPTRLAQLALANFGVEVLHTFRAQLEKNGLQPPNNWAGSHAARRFVEKLGFPHEYAGFEGNRLPRLVEVDGPSRLPPPHDFQAQLIGHVEALPTRSEGTRGLLSLPTGAGKTRVAVQGIVQYLVYSRAVEKAPAGPILWIAQTEELCEQALDTWRTVWRAEGTNERMILSRLWSTNEAEAAPENPHVVIATIDKLYHCTDDPQYNWLSAASWVVIDEAHSAITKETTEVLRWLGLTYHLQEKGQDRCPLLGLTATPFRPDFDESRRLAERFGTYRLDHHLWDEDPYPKLQASGVLAHVRQEELRGVDFRLRQEEIESVKVFGRLPSQAEERLSESPERNLTLLERIRNLPPDWPVLLFATSVSHAQTMASLLSVNDIPARSISGGTPKAARRYYIDEFRRGNIRVLTNFNVLTTGFDAPSVRCVIVARPVYSPSLYQQMIGRGLRGPINGGKEECLIINVADNILNYNGALAFRGFEYLWRKQQI